MKQFHQYKEIVIFHIIRTYIMLYLAHVKNVNDIIQIFPQLCYFGPRSCHYTGNIEFPLIAARYFSADEMCVQAFALVTLGTWQGAWQSLLQITNRSYFTNQQTKLVVYGLHWLS